MSDPASPETWTDAAGPVAPRPPPGTLIPEEDAAIAPTLVLGASAEPWRPGPTLAPAAARVTVLPEIVRLGDRPTLRERSEARFLVLGSAGEGGLGEVAVALDQDIGRKVAIKRIRQDRVTSDTVARFVEEIHTVGRLEHANIVPIHDVGRDATGALYFVMRYVEGETLEAVLVRLRAGDPATHRAWGFERRVGVIAQVLEALSFAHAHGIVHRDLKPANIMVGPYGEVMLLDWGVAQSSEVRAGELVGTPAYMAPEQARGESTDARSDVYAISVVLHELLTLRHYLEDCLTVADTLRAVQERPVPKAARVKSAVQRSVPMDLTWFVAQGVEKDPARRYPSAQAMLDRLAARAEGDVPIQCHVTFTQRVVSRGMRLLNQFPFAAAIATAAGVAVLGGAMWWVAPSR